MERLNFTMDEETIELLEELASRYFNDNKSLTVRSALESLAVHIAKDGWVVTGYSPAVIAEAMRCSTCGDAYEKGTVLLRPVFGRGNGPLALPHLPTEDRVECTACADKPTGLRSSRRERRAEKVMAACIIHPEHRHRHGPKCGHTAIKHRGRTYYLHDGHLHAMHGDHVDEHQLSVTRANPGGCTPAHDCGGHDRDHRHGPDCGHEAIPHGDHIDYLVEGHLHRPHDGHCDDHGAVRVAI